MQTEHRIRLQGEEALQAALRDLGRSSKYALRNALNETANAAQDAVRASLSRSFTLRRPEFVRRTIFRKPGEDFATVSRPQAAVRVDDTARAKGSRDFLAKFEEGGVKRPQPGQGRTVAIPKRVKRSGAGGVITRAWRPRALWQKEQAGNTRYARIEGRHDPLIVERYGRGRQKKVRVLYSLVERVRIDRRLRFHDVAGRAVDATWPLAVANAIENEIVERFNRGIAA